jgi:hypothetical protein
VGSEARRVLYVGASRAQTLLILAVHTDHANRVAGLLKRDGVNYDLVSLPRMTWPDSVGLSGRPRDGTGLAGQIYSRLPRHRRIVSPLRRADGNQTRCRR